MKSLPEVGASLLTDDDVHLFNEGTHSRLYDRLGARPTELDRTAGTHFAVWAPNAESVSVIGDWNGWRPDLDALRTQGQSGIWQGFLPNVGKGDAYKYHVRSRFNGYSSERADPFALYAEVSPKTASIVWDLSYEWEDGAWMASRAG